MSGALTQEGAFKLHNQAGSEVASVLQSGIVSGSAAGKFSTLSIDSVEVIDAAQGLKNIASLDATTEATVEAAIDTLANLASMGSDGSELEALGSLDVAGGLKVANSEVISSARAVSNITSVDGSGDLTMGTITMTGFSVDADGDTALKSLAVDNSSTIGCDADTDIMTLAAQSLALASDVDFNIAKTAGLKLGGVAVTSTAAELNLVDGITAGTVAASKAVIVDANKDADGFRNVSGSNLFEMGSLMIGDVFSADAEEGIISSGWDLIIENSSDVEKFSVAASSGAVVSATSITAGTSFVIGSADLNEADLEKLDGITNGTVAASKAVVVDANKDISGFRSLTASANVVAAKFFGDGAGITNINVGNLDAFGSDKQIQFNQNGEFSANAGLIYDGSGSLAVSGSSSGMQSSELYFGAPASKQGRIYVDEDSGYAMSVISAGGIDLSGSDGITAMMPNGTFLNVASQFENSGLKLVDFTGGTKVQLKRDGTVSGSSMGSFSSLAIDSVQVFSDAQQLQNVASLDATTEATVEAAIDTLANLASMGSNGSELEALGSLDVAQTFKIANSQLSDASKNLTAAGVSGSGNFSIGGTLSAASLGNATVALTSDLMIIDDGATGTIKTTSLAAYATALAAGSNEGLKSVAGRLGLDLNDLSAAAIASGDSFAFIDADDSSASKKESVDDLATLFAGNGLAAASAVLSLDLNELSAAAVDVAADSIAIVDATDNGSKKESIADLVTAMAGAGLTATNGVLSADASVAPNAIGDAAASLEEGFNYGNVSLTSARVWSLPAPQEVGDIVHVKAPANCSDSLTITVSGGTIDGESSVVLESPYAAVSLICVNVASDLWRLY